MNNGMFTSKEEGWETPQYVFNFLDREFGFTLDPCATAENKKCDIYFTKKENGLSQSWKNEIVFMNPPYGRKMYDWMRKAYTESATVVCLIPCRTDTKWFHDFVMKADELRLIKGRLKFGDGKQSAPFPSAIVIFRPMSGIEKPEIFSIKINKRRRFLKYVRCRTV